MGRMKIHRAIPAIEGKAVEAIDSRDWVGLNRLITDGLSSGEITPEDLDFSPEKMASSHLLSPQIGGPMWKSFEQAIDQYGMGHKEAVWLLRSWEAAAKVGWLDDVLQEIQGKDGADAGSSSILRQVYSAMRLFLADVQMDSHEMPLSLMRSSIGDEAAPGVARLTFSVAGDIQWKSKPLEKTLEASCLLDEESSHEAIRNRLGGRAYVECMDGQAYNDGSARYWCDGTLFFSKEPAALDAFVATRPNLTVFESALDHAVSSPKDLENLLKSGFSPDVWAEHRRGLLRPIHLACEKANADSLQLLLEHHSSPNRLDHEQQAPVFYLVHCALERFDPPPSPESFRACLSLMVAHGLDVNEAQPVTGETPLMLAACGKTHWPLLHLLECGADPLRKDHQGRTVFDRARDLDHANLARGCYRHVFDLDPNHANTPSADAIAYLDAWRANQEVSKLLATPKPMARTP